MMHALITGSGRGIGRAVALAFAEKGYFVYTTDIDDEANQETLRLIKDAGGEGEARRLDVSDPDAIASCFSQIEPLHVLINNAGISEWLDPFDLSVNQWDRVLNTNLRGPFLCSREAARKMEPGAAVVNIASTRAIMSEPNSEAYAASKGGIVGLTHALAISFGERRIRVNVISPGWINCDPTLKLDHEDHLQHPSGRVGKPEDIARACLFLCGPENDFVTGSHFVIDGGMTRKMIYSE